MFKNAKAFPNTENQHKVATATQNLDQIQGGTSHNQSLSILDSTTNLTKKQYEQKLKEIEQQEQYYHKLKYKPSIKPILDNLQKEF